MTAVNGVNYLKNEWSNCQALKLMVWSKHQENPDESKQRFGIREGAMVHAQVDDNQSVWSLIPSHLSLNAFLQVLTVPLCCTALHHAAALSKTAMAHGFMETHPSIHPKLAHFLTFSSDKTHTHTHTLHCAVLAACCLSISECEWIHKLQASKQTNSSLHSAHWDTHTPTTWDKQVNLAHSVMPQ